MKALGIVRKLDELGRVVIPKGVRTTQGWGAQQPLEMFMEDDRLIVKAYGLEAEKQEAADNLQVLLKQALDKDDDETADRLDKVIAYLEK